MSLVNLLAGYQQVFDNVTGAAVPGAIVSVFLSGTSTPVTTYVDPLGVTPSPTVPVPGILGQVGIQAAGDGEFLAYVSPGINLKLLYYTAAGVLIRSIDPFVPYGTTSLPSSDITTCHGRITLTSMTPVTLTDVTAATTLYFTPYQGSQIALYNGSNWVIASFSEVNLTVGGAALTASTMYDLYAYLNNGIVAITPVAWANVSTSPTRTTQNGILVQGGTGNAIYRYLGCFYVNGSSQLTDSAANRDVENYQNKVLRPLRYLMPTGTWTYNTATWRQANASAAAQVTVVCGVAEDALHLVNSMLASTAVANASAAIGIGENSTTAPAAVSLIGLINGTNAADGNPEPGVAWLDTVPPVGYNAYSMLEIAQNEASATTFYGTSGAGGLSGQTGLSGVWRG